LDVSVPFTSNYSDLSTDAGHQFEFFCERCGSGYKSTLKTSAVANIGAKATKGFGGMFGGKLSKVAGQADAALHNVTDSKTREKAFTAAVDEVGRSFHRCNVCRAWVCEEQCWDDEYNLCTTCAAEQRQQGTAPQAAAPPPQVSEAAQKVAEAFSGVIAQAKSATTCPSCGAAHAAGAKFCPECGQALAISLKCPSCGAESAAGTKFCPECGQSLVAG
jgi:Double zinc ribbon